ncbi:MAG: hypothetical protein AAFQ68_23630 [Bacteroidota bacterium]
MKIQIFCGILFGLLCLGGCAEREAWPQLSVEKIAIPADTACVFPSLALSRDHLWMSWLDESDDSLSRLRLAAFDGTVWSEEMIAAEGADWFVNWADFPSVTATPAGNLYTHTLQKSDTAVYAYHIKVRHYNPLNDQWSDAYIPYADRSATEHGFPSFVPLSEERLAMIWLDGRNYVKGGSEEMMLGYTLLENGQAAASSTFLDQRICDCCQTDMAMSSRGLIAVYRDRSPKEIRDIYYSRHINGQWTEPKPVHQDNWKIGGCPVNGPAIAAKGDTVAVAWFTSAGGEARVLASLSYDAGETFSTPSLIDAGKALGRVDIELDEQNRPWVSWIRQAEDTAFIQICSFREDGSKSPALRVQAINPRRASGFPQLTYWQHKLWLAWTATDPHKHLQFLSISLHE